MWGLTQGWVEDTLGLGQRSGPFRGSAEDGWWGAREGQEGRDKCIPMADSSQCMAETITIL